MTTRARFASIWRSVALAALVLGLSFTLFGCAYRDEAIHASDPAVEPGEDSGGNHEADDDAGEDAAPVLPEEWGPHGVGYRFFDWSDPTRGNRRVPTILYYPSTLPPPDQDEYENAKRSASLLDRVRMPAYEAVLDAPPAAGRWRVAVFSHGSGGRNIQYKYLTEFLASHGYVVAAPNHVGNVGVLHYMPFGIDQTVKRLFDIRFVLDRLATIFADPADPLFEDGSVDRVAVMGHSYGGNIALALGGAGYSWDYIEALCANDPADPYICPVVENRDLLEPILPDPRVAAVVSIAHDGTQSYFGPDGVGAAAMTIPVLLVSTEGDAFCPSGREAAPFFARLEAPVYWMHFFGASHIGFTDVKNMGPSPIGNVHRAVRGAVVGFLDRALKDQEPGDDLESGFVRLSEEGRLFEWFEKNLD